VIDLYSRSTNNREPTTDNSRVSASMSGEEEDDRSNDNAKNAEEGINPSVEWRGVRIGFGWHNIWKIKNAFRPRMTHKRTGVSVARIR
jgi:hypothetical protein